MKVAKNIVRWGGRGLVAATTVLACSSASTPSPNGSPQTEDVGGDALSSVQQALTVADSVFHFDPDLAPGNTAGDNALTMESRSKASTARCPNAKVTRTATTLTIDFGPPPGCPLEGGGTVSGSLEASVSGGRVGDGGLKGGGDVVRDSGADLADGGSGSLTVTLQFTKIVANGRSIDGAIALTTSSGNTFDVTITSLATPYGTINGKITLVGSPGSMRLDGNLSLAAAVTASLQLNGVIIDQNACYPRAGTETVTGLGRTVSTFDENTASSGLYLKQEGEKQPAPATLPPYGNCPPGPPGPGDAEAPR